MRRITHLCCGLKVLADARAAGLRTPVLILTTRGTADDRILGLNTGADDSLPKPFDLDELEARIRTLVRRGPGADERGLNDAQTAEFSGLHCDGSAGAIYFHGTALDLAPRELVLLRGLLAEPGKAVPKERLLWGILPPVKSIVIIDTVSLFRPAQHSANVAYHRTLLAPAKSIGEQLEVIGAGEQARLARERARERHLCRAGGLLRRRLPGSVKPSAWRCCCSPWRGSRAAPRDRAQPGGQHHARQPHGPRHRRGAERHGAAAFA